MNLIIRTIAYTLKFCGSGQMENYIYIWKHALENAITVEEINFTDRRGFSGTEASWPSH